MSLYAFFINRNRIGIFEYDHLLSTIMSASFLMVAAVCLCNSDIKELKTWREPDATVTNKTFRELIFLIKQYKYQ